MMRNRSMYLMSAIVLFFVLPLISNGVFVNAQTARTMPMPDLIVESITVNPVIPKAGQEFTISVTCKNAGSVAANPSHMSFRIGGGTPQLVPVPRLDPGASMTWQKKEVIQNANTYPVFVGADQQNNEVAESAENNNWKNMSFTVQLADVVSAESLHGFNTSAATPQTELVLKPDLTILEVSVSPTIPFYDQTIDLKILVKNVGFASTGWCTMAVRIYGPQGGAPVVNKSWDEVLGIFNPGTFKERHLNFTIKDLQTNTGPRWEGKYLIQVLADSKHKVDESDEGNNQKDFYFEVRKH